MMPVNTAVFSHNIWYRACTISHAKSSDTDYHRDMESMWTELLRGSSSVRHRPPDRKALGGSGEATLGLRPLAGSEAPVHGSQTPQAGAAGGGCRPGTRMARSDWLLSGEAGGLGPGTWPGDFGIDHSSVFTPGGVGPPQYQAAAAPLSERPSHATQ